MDVWIVIPFGYERYTRVFSNERKAMAYKTKWERDLVDCDIVETQLNKE